jgi:hypothetical protein
MLKRIVAIAFMALVPALSWANYAFVSQAQNASNGNTVTVSPAAGHFLIVVSQTSAGGGTPTASISDNLGDTWTVGKATSQDGTIANNFFSIFYLPVAPAGITTITLTYAGGTPGAANIAFVEYSGLSSTGFQGVSTFNQQQNPGTATNAITTNNINVATQPGALIGWFNDGAGSGGWTAGTSPLTFTMRVNGSFNMLEDARVTATGNALANATSTHGTTQTYITYAIFIAEPSSGGGAALASAATDAVTAVGALTTVSSAFVPLLLDNASRSDNLLLGTAPGDGTGDSARIGGTKLKQWAADANAMFSQLYPNRSLQTPTTGFSIAASIGVTQLVLNPAGTLATGTVTLPTLPGDNQPFTLMTSQTVTTLTVNTADTSTINGAPTTISANTSVKFRYITSLNRWFRE